MLGRHEDRLARFAKYGTTLRAGADNGVAALRKLGFGQLQVLVETSGSMTVLSDLLPMMRRNGHMVIAGFYPKATEVNLLLALQKFRNHELTFDLVSGATQPRLDSTMRWIAEGKLDTLSVITHRFPVAQAAEAWALIESKREPVLGVVLDWPAARQ
jgi:threonine dehydrogenase-like Zn-dependent dehydrogenase